MIETFLIISSIYGFNLIVWGTVSSLRAVGDLFLYSRRRRQYSSCGRGSIPRERVAILIPAHNEELVIEETLSSARALVPAENIFVASDGSSDSTAEKVRAAGSRVVEIMPSRGKAGALAYAIDHFSLADKFDLVMILDADSRPSPHYLDHALPFFADHNTVALAGYAKSYWPRGLPFSVGEYLISYRSRLYTFLQRGIRYGQTWGRLSLSSIVPGFASLYRSHILQHIDINPGGLVIEDFNMTFELHRKRLGSIAHDYRVFAYTQDPDNFSDYTRQIRRWNLGFWQTVRRHGVWPSFFWIVQGFFLAEVFLASAFLLAIPVLLGFSLGYSLFHGGAYPPVLFSVPWRVTVWDVSVAVFAADYILTAVVAAVDRRPRMLLYGLFYFPLRVIDAWMFYYTLVLAFFTSSSGKWKSPSRRKF